MPLTGARQGLGRQAHLLPSELCFSHAAAAISTENAHPDRDLGANCAAGGVALCCICRSCRKAQEGGECRGQIAVPHAVTSSDTAAALPFLCSWTVQARQRLPLLSCCACPSPLVQLCSCSRSPPLPRSPHPLLVRGTQTPCCSCSRKTAPSGDAMQLCNHAMFASGWQPGAAGTEPTTAAGPHDDAAGQGLEQWQKL